MEIEMGVLEMSHWHGKFRYFVNNETIYFPSMCNESIVWLYVLSDCPSWQWYIADTQVHVEYSPGQADLYIKQY